MKNILTNCAIFTVLILVIVLYLRRERIDKTMRYSRVASNEAKLIISAAYKNYLDNDRLYGLNFDISNASTSLAKNILNSDLLDTFRYSVEDHRISSWMSKETLLDPWGESYLITMAKTADNMIQVSVTSKGADKIQGTSDDVIEKQTYDPHDIGTDNLSIPSDKNPLSLRE